MRGELGAVQGHVHKPAERACNGRLTNTGRGAEPGKGSGQWDRSDDWAVWIVLLLILALMDG